MKPHDQQSIPGTEPVEPNPAIRTKLDRWLDATDEAKDAGDAKRARHDELIGAMVADGKAIRQICLESGLE